MGTGRTPWEQARAEGTQSSTAIYSHPPGPRGFALGHVSDSRASFDALASTSLASWLWPAPNAMSLLARSAKTECRRPPQT